MSEEPSKGVDLTSGAKPHSISNQSGEAPVTMLARPEPRDAEPVDSTTKDGIQGSSESFEAALARLEKGENAPVLLSTWARILRRKWKKPEDRMVAFDGFRSQLYEDKKERDRRYGTVYSVIERPNGFLITLEFPRRLPVSSLGTSWQVPLDTPHYDYEIRLVNGSTIIVRAGLKDESQRRLSYVSPSFPSDFSTTFNLAQPVNRIVHRFRDRNLEIIAFKSGSI